MPHLLRDMPGGFQSLVKAELSPTTSGLTPPPQNYSQSRSLTFIFIAHKYVCSPVEGRMSSGAGSQGGDGDVLAVTTHQDFVCRRKHL